MNFPFQEPTPIIETIFPAQAVHIIGGPSGAGKSSWLIKMLQEWSEGKQIFGYTSHPVPYMIVSYDRSRREFFRTCARLKVDASKINFLDPKGHEYACSLEGLLKDLKRKNPEIKLFVIEGIVMKTPNGKFLDQVTVGTWLKDKLQNLCEELDITLIGVMHTTKLKEKDSYSRPRERLSGTSAWAAYSSTVILIEPEVASNPEVTARKLYLLPRNDRERVLDMDFRDGTLIELKRVTKEQAIIEHCSQDPTRDYTTEELGTVSRLQHTALNTILNRLIAARSLTRTAPGLYRLSPTNTLD